METKRPRDPAAEAILARLGDADRYPDEVDLVPYGEFSITTGGFLYHKDPGAEEVEGFFCCYLTDEI